MFNLQSRPLFLFNSLLFIGTVVTVAHAGESMCDEPAWVAGMFGYPGPQAPVLSMAVHDDGSGPGLYVSGNFNEGGGVYAHGILRWDGRVWSSVGQGFGSTDVTAHTNAARSMVVYDDGNGPMLYAGGFFNSEFGSPVDYIARWDGRRWNSVGAGVVNYVNDLTTFDAGNGPVLVAAGYFACWISI